MILQPYRKTYSRLKFTQEKISSADFLAPSDIAVVARAGPSIHKRPARRKFNLFGKICNEANAEISASKSLNFKIFYLVKI